MPKITNHWGEARMTKIDAETFEVYRGVPGAAYNHHPQLTSLKGRLFATWSNGCTNEDDPGQQMVLATSDDDGRTWSEARPLVGRRRGAYFEEVQTAMGIYVHGGGLAAYCGVYEYAPEMIVPGDGPPERLPLGKGQVSSDMTISFGDRTEIHVSRDGGETWRREGGIDGLVANLCPSPLASGRLLIPGNLRYAWTDDPSGVHGWTCAGIPGLPPDYTDAPGKFQREFARRRGDLSFCEGSFYQTDDGVVHMMLRSDAPAGRLGVTESADEGQTWSEPVLTEFTDARCRFHFGRLPDGRFFGLSCPAPRSGRTPLVIAMSEDGVSFDRHFIIGDEPDPPPRLEGQHKGGRYGYPSLHITGDRVFVIYSIAKEDIAVCRFDLASLGR